MMNICVGFLLSRNQMRVANERTNQRTNLRDHTIPPCAGTSKSSPSQPTADNFTMLSHYMDY